MQNEPKQPSNETTAELPRSVPWTADLSRADYIARLWEAADARRVEADRLEKIIDETIAEARRIEALAEKMENER